MAGEYEWNSRFGSGSKIAAVRTLCSVDQASAIALAYETLANDLQSAEGLAGALIEVMDDILALLNPSVPSARYLERN